MPATTERFHAARVGNEHRDGRQGTSYIFRFINQTNHGCWVSFMAGLTRLRNMHHRIKGTISEYWQ